jgi:acid phosphatase type 7
LSLITCGSLGNHEYGYNRGNTSKDLSLVADHVYRPEGEGFGHDSQGECAIPVYYRFGMPDKGLPPYYYSFNYGNAHFLMLSSEHNFSQGSPQYRWMEDDLRSVDRNLIPFVIVTSHRPMYVSESWPTRLKATEHQKDAYEDLVSQFVSVVFPPFSRICFPSDLS